MSPRVRQNLFSAAALFGIVCLILASAVPLHAQNPLPGAIFTTNSMGTRVNQNQFQNKCDVYLDGGPGPNAPAGAAGLPDGDYFFQVTDPSGKHLLSTDPVVNRQFQVTGGIISGLSGLGNHGTGTDIDHGATTIQLCPFLDTPNKGGVYKAWITPVQDFVGDPTLVDDPCGRGCFHGFIPAASKVDNFKVKGGTEACLQVWKFIDQNGNGVQDSNEKLLNRWPVTVFDPLGAQINGLLFANSNDGCIVFNLQQGVHRVVESTGVELGVMCVVSANILDGSAITPPDVEVLVRIRPNDKVRTLVYGNTACVSLTN